MPSKLEQLKQEIQRLRPEILKLEFGCEYIENDIPYTYLNSVYSWCEKRPIATNGNINEDEIEILGRLITLDDVLAVIKFTVEAFNVSPKIKENEVFIIAGVKGIKQIKIVWLLGKPLDDQSEETINFLHSLIVK